MNHQNNKRYAVHPGWVSSFWDGDQHYIDAGQLMNLYRLNHSNCIIWDTSRPETYVGRNYKDYFHVYPSHYYGYKK